MKTVFDIIKRMVQNHQLRFHSYPKVELVQLLDYMTFQQEQANGVVLRCDYSKKQAHCLWITHYKCAEEWINKLSTKDLMFHKKMFDDY